MRLLRVRMFVFCLCCILFFSRLPVYAASVSQDSLALAQYHFSQLGFITKDWDWFLENDAFLDYISKIEDGIYFFIDDDGFYNFSTEASAAARAIIDIYINEQTGGSVSDYDYGDYYIVPTFSYDDIWFYVNSHPSDNAWPVGDRNDLSSMMERYDSITFYHEAVSNTATTQYVTVYGLDYTNDYFLFCDTLSGANYPETLRFNIADSSGQQYNKSITGVKIYPLGSSSNVNVNSSVSTSNLLTSKSGTTVLKTWRYLVTRNGENIRVWKSSAKLSSFLTGTGAMPKFYTNSSFTNFDVSQDNSFSIDQQTYNNIKGNFNTVKQQFSQVIDDINIQNNSSITYHQLQQIIDNSITNIVNNYYYVIVDPEEPETETGPGNQEVLDKLDEQSKQDKEFREEDLEGASSAGDAMGTFASDLESGIYNQWKILWFPIEFTESVLSAFQGSSGSTYSLRYDGITGYTYDSESGTLQPVYSKSRGMPGIPSVSRGTVLTFPEYTLPGLNIKLWDSYQYDLTILTVDYPLIFDSLYVLCCVIESVWFVEFLHRKFMEVFTR